MRARPEDADGRARPSGRTPHRLHRRRRVDEWALPNRGLVEEKLAQDQFFEQRKCYAFDDHTKHFFNNDRDMPYSTPDGRPFSWIRGNQLGGKSLMWARQSYRWSDLDFGANAKDGHGTDWPIRYADLAPWYSHVEKHAGISGARENMAVLPDSEFLPAFEFNTVEAAMKKNSTPPSPRRA